MSGRVYVSRAYGWIPVVPGESLRTVTRNGQKHVTRRYEYPNRRADTPNQSQPVAADRTEDPGFHPVRLLLGLIIAFDWAICALILWISR